MTRRNRQGGGARQVHPFAASNNKDNINYIVQHFHLYAMAVLALRPALCFDSASPMLHLTCFVQSLHVCNPSKTPLSHLINSVNSMVPR